MGSLERIENAARKVAKAKDAGHDVVVVSSAMAGTTDRLIQMAKQIQPIPNPRELDMLLATGEQQAIALFAMTLQKMGYKAISLCGWQVPIITDDVHTKARIKAVSYTHLTLPTKA